MHRSYAKGFILLIGGIIFSCQLGLAHSNEGIIFYIEKDFKSLTESKLDFDQKESELQRLLKLSISNFTKFDTTSSKVLNELSKLYESERKFEKALDFKLEDLSVLEHFQDTKSLAICYTEIGDIYNSLSEHYKAEDYHLKALAAKKDLFDHSYYRNYSGLSESYYEQGKYSLLKKYAGYALDVAKGPEQIIDAKYHATLAHARMDEIDKGKELCKEVIAMAKSNNLTFRLGRAYTNLGWLAAIEARIKKSMDYYKSGIDYYKKGISIIEKSEHEHKNLTLAYNYSTLCNMYRQLAGKSKDENDIVLSFRYGNASIQKAKIYYGEDYNPDMGTLYYNLATKYISLKDDRIEGLKYVQEAVKCYMKDSTLDQVDETIPKEELYRVNQKWRLLYSIKEKAFSYAHLYLQTENIEHLKKAEKHIRNAVDMIDIMRAEMSEKETKLFWRKETRVIYDIGVELSEWLEDNEKVFFYLEKSKSILLLEELNQKEVKKLIPAKLVEREGQLLDDYVKSKSDEHFYFGKYNSFIDSLSIAYPSYYKYKFDTQPPTIREIQSNVLDDSTHLVQYYITYDSLYTLNITKDNVELLTQKKEPKRKLENDIKRFLTFVNNKDSLEFEKEYVDFVALSAQLHDKLFSNIKHKKPNTIIVGDGLIGYLPFDALVKEVDRGVPKYLIEDHLFSFASSVSILQKKKKKKRENFNSLLIVCPEEFKSQELQPLVQSKMEVKSLSRLTSSKVLGKGEASLENFKRQSSDFDVIHFSSHSGMDTVSNRPWIAFQDSTINLDEIYKLHLNASLVTLSSCKSFDGDFQAGEGINSLARAFLFADASAVVGSLWNLNEVSGFEILEEFYKNLRKNQTKPQALREAKLKFIKNNPYKSPYHWASLVCIGNPEELSFKTPLKMQWIIPIVLFLSFLSYRFFSFFQRKES